MNFIPEIPKNSNQAVPFYEDATRTDGWQGQATEKSIKTLQAETIEAVSRLGGSVTSFQRGSFQGENGTRDGFRIHYMIEVGDGKQMAGRIDIAALPVKNDFSLRRTETKRKEAALKMALYMLRIALEGTWFLQQLSPGYSALVPFMLGPGEKTISEWWAESTMKNLLPPGDEEFLEGEIIDEKTK
jgi:hypothetical protein